MTRIRPIYTDFPENKVILNLLPKINFENLCVFFGHLCDINQHIIYFRCSKSNHAHTTRYPERPRHHYANY